MVLPLKKKSLNAKNSAKLQLRPLAPLNLKSCNQKP